MEVPNLAVVGDAIPPDSRRTPHPYPILIGRVRGGSEADPRPSALRTNSWLAFAIKQRIARPMALGHSPSPVDEFPAADQSPQLHHERSGAPPRGHGG